MESKVYETKFEYYLARNGMHKISLLRKEIKDYLKKIYVKEIKYTNSNKKKVKFKRSNFSYTIGFIQSEKNIKDSSPHANRKMSKGLLSLVIRTNLPMKKEEIQKIAKMIKGSSNQQKRKTEIEKEKYEIIYENRYNLLIFKRSIDINTIEPTFVIKKSSPIALETQKSGEKFKLELPSELIERLQMSIQKRYCNETQLKICNIEGGGELYRFDDKKNLGYITYSKKEKYKSSQELVQKIKEKKNQIIENKKQKTNSKNIGEKEIKSIENRAKKELLKTYIFGYANFKVVVNEIKNETMRNILIEGLGGKNGTGMGFLHLEKDEIGWTRIEGQNDK